MDWREFGKRILKEKGGGMEGGGFCGERLFCGGDWDGEMDGRKKGGREAWGMIAYLVGLKSLLK